MDSATADLPQLVETETALAELAHVLGRQARVSVDTESNSLHAYRERVCLIQFSTLEQDYVVDPLAFGNLKSLGAIFSEPRIEKIFHASEYDLICLRRDYGFSFSNIFDTMQAGRILGRKQAGLDRLLEEKFGITISKRFQKADWGVRPLSRDLLLYAVLDTHYLIALRDLLKTELQQRGLWELAQEDFRMACNAGGPKPKSQAPSWSRFGMRRDLSARELTVLKELLASREDIAQRLDRPPFKVLDDERLIEIARAGPSTPQELAETGLSSRQMESWGGEVLEAVRRGMESSLVERTRPPAPDGAYLRRLDKLKEWRKKTAAAMEVESDVVLPRSLLLALIENPSGDVAAIMQSSPWRLQQFGDQISQVLQAAGRRGQSLCPSS